MVLHRTWHKWLLLLLSVSLGIWPSLTLAEAIKPVAPIYPMGDALAKHPECRVALSNLKQILHLSSDSEKRIEDIVAFFQKSIEADSMTLLSPADKSWVEDKGRIFSAFSEAQKLQVALYIFQRIQLQLKELDQVEEYNQFGYPITRTREKVYGLISDFYLIQIAIVGLSSSPRIHTEHKRLRRELLALSETIAKHSYLPQALQEHLFPRWFPQLEG